MEGLNEFWSKTRAQQWIETDGTWTGMPWTFGSIGITYNSAEIDGCPRGTTCWTPA